jgi:hypothetical protein
MYFILLEVLLLFYFIYINDLNFDSCVSFKTHDKNHKDFVATSTFFILSLAAEKSREFILKKKHSNLLFYIEKARFARKKHG